MTVLMRVRTACDQTEPPPAEVAPGAVLCPSVPGMAKLSKDTQVKAVCEGLALGSVALGVKGVTSPKMDLESALRHAWRR